MILCPIQNKWIQLRPYITQEFGKNPQVYSQFGLKGHNGIDLRAKVGTPLFAPFEGKVKAGNQGDKGYGKYIRIYKDNLEVILGHLTIYNIIGA